MTDRNRRFVGKTIIITGAAGGLGRAYALGFAREGGHVIGADIARDGLAETSRKVIEAGGSAEHVFVDMGSEETIRAFADTIAARHPRVDVLINNAGIAYGEVSRSFAELDQASWLRFLAVNSVGPLLLAQALRPQLRDARGVVLNQSSMASFSPGQAYGVTKATLNAMTYGMAQAFAGDAIRVNAIAPGLIETDAARGYLDDQTWSYLQGLQLMRDAKGSSDDVVALALFLASDEGRFINCDVVSCDGGSTLRGWRN